MDIYAESDYKVIIRKRVKEQKSLTLQKLAARIPLQNTYLSKALRDEKTHLNEDHLYQACKILKFFPQEIDYVFLLRSRAIAVGKERKSYLDSKIGALRARDTRSAELQEFGSRHLGHEMQYLFDPIATVVHASLFVPAFREHPSRLCAHLGITQAKLREILERLHSLGFIRLNEKFAVVEILQNQIHYGSDHPLVRAHQSQVRLKSATHFNELPDADKQCFLATFSADKKTFEAIHERFRGFLKEIEPLITAAPSENVFQINFDLFKWF